MMNLLKEFSQGPKTRCPLSKVINQRSKAQDINEGAIALSVVSSEYIRLRIHAK